MAAKEKIGSWLAAWLCPLLFLLAAVAAAPTASALTPGAAETRARQKSLALLETRQAEPFQAAGLHQENASAVYDFAPESLLAAKGGIGTVLQGQAGVARAIGEIEAQGGQVLSREVTLQVGAGRTRPDLFIRNAQGGFEFVEVKNGAGAALNPNQARLFPQIQQSGAIPRGARAAEGGLQPGVPIGPTPVRVITYP